MIVFTKSDIIFVVTIQYSKNMAKFKQEVLAKIKSDPDLFAVVATKMKVKPVSLASMIDRNGNALNQYGVVKVVADYLKKDPAELLEEESEVKEPVK